MCITYNKKSLRVVEKIKPSRNYEIVFENVKSFQDKFENFNRIS